MDDEAFLQSVAHRLAGLPGVQAVALGGSRAEGTERADSDWDLSLYYRGRFEPQALRDIGWPGRVSELGGWSAIATGVFNGGAWLEIDGRSTDVHYRDLDAVDRVLEAAQHGRFDVEPLWFHLAPVPSYLLLAELASNRVLVGALPHVEYPAALSREASERWWAQAEAEFDYARRYHAGAGRAVQTLGLTARAASCAAHAVLAASGRWITNEKQLLARAGLADVDRILAAPHADPADLAGAVERVRTVCRTEVERARAGLLPHIGP